VTEESKVLQIVREDILRVLGERKGRASLKRIKEEVGASSFFIHQAFNLWSALLSRQFDTGLA